MFCIINKWQLRRPVVLATGVTCDCIRLWMLRLVVHGRLQQSMTDTGLQPRAALQVQEQMHTWTLRQRTNLETFCFVLHPNQGRRRMSGVLHHYFLLYSFETRSVTDPGARLAARRPRWSSFICLPIAPRLQACDHTPLFTGVLRMWTQVFILAQVMSLTKLSSQPRTNSCYQWAEIYNWREDLTPASHRKLLKMYGYGNLGQVSVTEQGRDLKKIKMAALSGPFCSGFPPDGLLLLPCLTFIKGCSRKQAAGHWMVYAGTQGAWLYSTETALLSDTDAGGSFFCQAPPSHLFTRSTGISGCPAENPPGLLSLLKDAEWEATSKPRDRLRVAAWEILPTSSLRTVFTLVSSGACVTRR